ncbi:MAG TPA: outer membrane lipoprotein-sorting protein [Thermodesulfobacteriota bacterium]|nr:outer membrane lipoprotein-sorting protein [Deltaproteobacteria bacterium]HNR12138.1 outer membrane lipoprotein-sorting protein [Thermodesulfobacteriota bacterium]HQO77825.1 outer membrane lipoprotein-sorting protein [Thermodesulfobacteriota bacterium]
MKTTFAILVVAFVILLVSGRPSAEVPPADDIVRRSFDYMRGKASTAIVNMTIHRPDWERLMRIKVWTKGETDSLFTIIAPAKDADNATLKKGREMWMFNPKVNRVIKVPPSMMSQSWMGSDFSNNDLAKSDSIIHDYTHTITGKETVDSVTVYSVTSLPKPNAPVIWGMQKLKIREDGIYLREEFYDEDLRLVKALTFSDLQPLGGKLYPRTMKMEQADKPDEYTVVTYDELEFMETLPDSLFTLSSLKTPRR